MNTCAINYIIGLLKAEYKKQYIELWLLDKPESLHGYFINCVHNMLIIHVDNSMYYIDIDKISYIALYDGYKNGAEIDES